VGWYFIRRQEALKILPQVFIREIIQDFRRSIAVDLANGFDQFFFAFAHRNTPSTGVKIPYVWLSAGLSQNLWRFTPGALGAGRPTEGPTV
jgi:hypothetical protein